MKNLWRALKVEQEDQLPCQDCQDSLPEYLLARMSPTADMTPWRDLELHLALCPACWEAVEGFETLVALADGTLGDEPPSYPLPQLAAAQKAAGDMLDRVSRVVIKLTHEIKRSLQSPMPAPAFALRRSSVGQVVVKDAVDDLQVEVEIQQDDEAPERCAITVKAQISGREWPDLDGTAVTLRQDGRDPKTKPTDSHGQVVFEDVMIDDLPSLTIVVQPSA